MPIPATSKALGAAASILGAIYLDQKHGFSTDLRQLQLDRQFRKRLAGRIAQLGDEATLYRMIELAKPDAPALWFEGRIWTYSHMKLEVDNIAAILQNRGIGEGDFVAIFMTNSPEMLFAYTAITKLGAVPAMINSALRKDTLAHCMNIANAKLIVSSPDLTEFVIELFDETGLSIPCISLNLCSFEPLVLTTSGKRADRIVQVRYEDLAAVQVKPLPRRPKRTPKDIGVLIYTSGTSGKPKAVSIKNFILLVVSTPVSLDVNSPKRYLNPIRTYSCLPLFHATALFTGPYYSAGNSGAFCLSRKFSASNFSKELTESGATRMLYVGEICRYMLRAPPSDYDHAHKCIVAHGNGLQKDIWERFKERFNIPEIREIYRSTEGVVKFDNWRQKSGVGMVGYNGLLQRYLEQEMYIVKHDSVTESPYRDPKTGFCVKSSLGEPGEAIGRVRTMDFYPEYLDNSKANGEKLIKDVFEKGDLFQRSGDMLVRQKDGWVRFHDRSGDTFRWRGENVSTGEVREHISRLKNVHDVVVYGVKLDKYDGQAGAAGITLHNDTPEAEKLFIDGLYTKLRNQGLTDYQIPKLVRFIKEIETNATFKHAKTVLKQRPWDPDAVQEDRLYWLDGSSKRYVRLDAESWGEIREGRARL